MPAWVITIVTTILEALFGPKESPATTEAEKAGAAGAQLQEEEAAHAVTDQAAAVRSAADTAVLQHIAEAGPAVDPAINSKLRDAYPSAFRD